MRGTVRRNRLLVLDTNVLLDAANGHSQHHDPCRRFIDGLRLGTTPAFLVWGVCYEFLRVITHPNVSASPLGRREAVGFIDELLALPGFGVLAETDRHTAVLARTLDEFPDIRGAGCTTCTRSS